jgi:hypothetical protein
MRQDGRGSQFSAILDDFLQNGVFLKTNSVIDFRHNLALF